MAEKRVQPLVCDKICVWMSKRWRAADFGRVRVTTDRVDRAPERMACHLT